jgi:hypothetical protein
MNDENSAQDITEEFAPIAAQPPREAPTQDTRRIWLGLGLVAAALLVAVWWGLTQPISMGEAPSSAPPSPTPPTNEASGQVTAAAGLPDAQPLTNDVIAALDDQWILAAFDGGAYGMGSGRLTGPTVLYGIDPEGTTYEMANLTDLGAMTVVAWDPDRAVVLVITDGAVPALRAYDLATGSLSPTIDPCAGYEQAGSTTARAYEGHWRVYSLCRDETVPDDATWGEAVFVNSTTVDDQGQLITDRGTVSTSPGRYLMLVGDTPVTWAYPDEPDPNGLQPSASPDAPGEAADPPLTPQVLAHRADGATVMIDTPAQARWCRAAGPGRGQTVALACVNRDASGALVSEAPFDGSSTFATRSWPGIGVTDVSSSHTCATDTVLALQAPASATAPVRLLVDHGDDDPTQITMVDEVAQACFGSRDGRLLVGGVEGLGWYNPAGGTTEMLLQSPTPSMLGMDPDQWVQGVITPFPMVFPLDATSSQGVLIGSDD